MNTTPRRHCLLTYHNLHNPNIFGDDYVASADIPQFEKNNPWINIPNVRKYCEENFGNGVFENLFDIYIKIDTSFQKKIDKLQDLAIPPILDG